jgi:CDP-diacylglycerol---glycerol-3-phosphate 3-phosphatidyltransferase
MKCVHHYVLTYALRAYVLAKGATAFGMMQSKWGQFLISSRFMRALYGIAKPLIFVGVWLTLLAAADAGLVLGPARTIGLGPLHQVARWPTLLVIGLTVLRGIPVLIEAQQFFAPSSSAS